MRVLSFADMINVRDMKIKEKLNKHFESFETNGLVYLINPLVEISPPSLLSVALPVLSPSSPCEYMFGLCVEHSTPDICYPFMLNETK